MNKATDSYKQRLFEVAAEYGKAGRIAYGELEQHIDDAVEDGFKPADVLAELGRPEQAIRAVMKADGKATYPLGKIIASGVLVALGLGFLAAISSLLMPLGSRLAGMRAISGDPANLPYTAERCHDFQRLVPSAHSCREAAMLHHYYELTDGRLVFAVISLICLIALFFAVRKGWLNLLPRKTLLLLSASIYIAVGALLMLDALGDLSSGLSNGWLDGFLTGVPILTAGLLLLAYYLGYITKPRRKEL
jgi:hypothetical protein